MVGVASRAWAWLRSWGGGGPAASHTKAVPERPGGHQGWGSWVWGSWRRRSDPAEEFWEAQEKLPAVEVDDVRASRPTRWWGGLIPTSYLWSGPELRRRKVDASVDRDGDGDDSDYDTPPPSPTPTASSLSSPFRLFVSSWMLEIAPEHYEICFNFLRHMFDLCVVAFLWTVSPPTKLVLEVLGVQGALRLWFHGMAMFLVSTVGMAGLLWLIQEYLAQFALVYGIIQALVISVSVRQSVVLGVDEERDENAGETTKTEEMKDSRQQKDPFLSP